MQKYRSFIVWVTSIFILMLAFMYFVLNGWPGQPNSCVGDGINNSCYCESFEIKDITGHKPGVRQPVNTWSNLYAIFTAFIVAFVVFKDRKRLRVSANTIPIQSKSGIPDLYVFVVLFLGLGSMWYHGSLTIWGGYVDGMSMYAYAAFLVFYTLRRIWASDSFFWVGYILAVAIATTVHTEDISKNIIITFLIAYIIAEIIVLIRTGKILMGSRQAQLLWVSAFVSILVAFYFWGISQTGGTMCDPHSLFQPHGLIWHPLAGLMAVLMYFYWRCEEPHTLQKKSSL